MIACFLQLCSPWHSEKREERRGEERRGEGERGRREGEEREGRVGQCLHTASVYLLVTLAHL